MISGGFRSQGKRLDSVLQYRKFWFVWLFWIVLAVIDISHRFMVVSACLACCYAASLAILGHVAEAVRDTHSRSCDHW